MTLSVAISTANSLYIFAWLAWFVVPVYLLNSNKPESTTTTIKASGSYEKDSFTPDPGSALEGNCIVVCDALVPSVASTQPFPGIKKPSRRLAFSVVKNDNLIINSPGENSKVIMFDYILLDIGNAFDLSKGTYKAKANGVYSFHFTVFKNLNRNRLTVGLMASYQNETEADANSENILQKKQVSGVTKLSAFAESTEARHDMAQNSALISLLEGDTVYLEVKDGNLDGGWQYSTFSGFLLHED